MSTDHPALDEVLATPVSNLWKEIWECRSCGKDVPCRVEITHQPTKYPHIEAQPRFTTRNRGCLCDNRLDPDWKQLERTPLVTAWTPAAKLQALAYRFYQGAAWEPMLGDLYCITRAGQALCQIAAWANGRIWHRTIFDDNGQDATSWPLTEWSAEEFQHGGFMEKRCFVPPHVLKLEDVLPPDPTRFKIENYGAGVIVGDYTGLRGPEGMAWAGRDGEWHDSPSGMEPFRDAQTATSFAQAEIEKLKP